jgi:hypothetical protein
VKSPELFGWQLKVLSPAQLWAQRWKMAAKDYRQRLADLQASYAEASKIISGMEKEGDSTE